MPTSRKVQRKRDSRGAGNNPAVRAGNNPSYRPEPAKDVVINGRKCVQLDGSRIADAAIMAGEGAK
jgi:hypothetical protein